MWATPQALKQYFSRWGDVARAHVVRPFLTGKGGAAFVNYTTSNAARAAVIATDQLAVEGSVLRCVAPRRRPGRWASLG